MKREQITSQSYIDWLKSLGCVVYLPLSEWDLKDYISGVNIVQDAGSFEWNTSKQMYQFNVPQTSGSAAILRNNFDKTWFTTNGFSFLIHFRKLQNLSGARVMLYNIQQGGFSGFNILYNGSSNMTNIPSDYHFAVTMDSSRLYTAYQDGVLYTQVQIASGNPYIKIPSDWIINQNNKGLWIGCNAGGAPSGSYCMNEIYIFDGVLDLQTIRKIQEYE